MIATMFIQVEFGNGAVLCADFFPEDGTWRVFQKQAGDNAFGQTAETCESLSALLNTKVKEGFERIIMRMEDNMVLFPGNGLAVGIDLLTGITHAHDAPAPKLTNDEVAAIIESALALDGEGPNYDLAAKAVEAWPTTCRPIPQPRPKTLGPDAPTNWDTLVSKVTES